jgi:hypothetical protein
LLNYVEKFVPITKLKECDHVQEKDLMPKFETEEEKLINDRIVSDQKYEEALRIVSKKEGEIAILQRQLASKQTEATSYRNQIQIMLGNVR